MAEAETVVLPFGESGPLQDNYEESSTFSHIKAVQDPKYITFYAVDSSGSDIAKILKVSRTDGVIYLYKDLPTSLGFRLDDYGCIMVENPADEDFDMELEEDTDTLVPAQ